MANVSWQDISQHVQDAFDTTGRVERRVILEFAEVANAPDDIIDAIDAIGSRVFPDVESAKSFLESQGQIS